MARVLTIASALGVYGVFESFGMFWIARDYLALPPPIVQASDLPQIARVRAHDDLSDTQQGTDLGTSLAELEAGCPLRSDADLGTLAVVYGWFMTPTGWGLALMVWAYTLVSFIRRERGQDRHLSAAGI